MIPSKPLILINCKTYPEALGKNGLLFARKLAAVKMKKYEIALAPSLLTLPFLAIEPSFSLFAQHVDLFPPGAHTGSLTAEELKELEVRGTILNHSEKKVPFSILKQTVKRCKQLKLSVVLCASTLQEAKKLLFLKSEYLAYEPKELIGSSRSVTDVHPDIIAKAISLAKKMSPTTKVLCGAGVHARKDVLRALELGCQGVLVAHAVVQAKQPQKVLEEMVR